MATGDVKVAYSSSTNLTVTNLNSLAASSTYVAGWESAAIDNTSNLYEDYILTAKLTTASSNRQVGEIRMYVVGPLDDSTWPDVFDGSESTETVTTANIRDAICFLAAFTVTSNTNSEVYYLNCGSVREVFGGQLPKKFVIYISGNATTTTTAQLSSSGNQVTWVGVYRTVAA